MKPIGEKNCFLEEKYLYPIGFLVIFAPQSEKIVLITKH